MAASSSFQRDSFDHCVASSLNSMNAFRAVCSVQQTVAITARLCIRGLHSHEFKCNSYDEFRSLWRSPCAEKPREKLQEKLHSRHFIQILRPWTDILTAFTATKTYKILFNATIFTALHGMQTRSSDENSVCLSVSLSVCQTRELWQNGRKISAYFYTMRKII